MPASKATPVTRQLALVRQLQNRDSEKVREALEDLLEMNRRGELPSLVFIAPRVGRDRPSYGVVGRLRGDPVRVLGELAAMHEKVKRWAADVAPHLEV